MKGKIAAALLLTTIAFATAIAFSTTASASHAASITLINENTGLARMRGYYVGENLVITVKNLGGDPIDNVAVDMGATWENAAGLIGPAPVLEDVAGWTEHTILPALSDNRCFSWVTTAAENRITSGASKTFKVIPPRSPPAAGSYTITVATKDNTGAVESYPLTITIDNTAPTVTVSVSPRRVKKGVSVTVTVTSTEALKGFDNVLLREGDNAGVAIENRVVTLSPVAGTDNKSWSGTIAATTIDNRQGVDNLGVINARDLALNAYSVEVDNALLVDELPPVVPSPIDTIPTLENRSTYVISGYARDNTCDASTRLPTVAAWDNVKVELLKDNVVIASDYSRLPLARFNLVVTGLAQGSQTLKLKVTDEAGNSWENAAYVTVFFDNVAPTIELQAVTVGNLKAPNENRSLAAQFKENVGVAIKVKVTDATFGFDNTQRYTITVRENASGLIPTGWENGTANWEWDNVNKWFSCDNGLGTWRDNWFQVEVLVADNLNFTENKKYFFKCDNVAPTVPTQTATIVTMGKGQNIALAGTTEAVTEATHKITIIYKDNYSGATLRTDSKVISVAADGSWSYTISAIPEANTTRDVSVAYAGKVTIVLVAVDAAGNTSAENAIGTMLVDRTPPAISIAGPPDGYSTSDVMVRVYGTVTDTYSGVTSANVAGQVIQLADGGYSATIWLAEGANTITVSATDAVGNSATKTITIHRTVAPWALIAVVVAIVAVLLAAVAVLRRRS